MKAKERTDFLCECLSDNYIRLLKQYPNREITINEIIQCSGVGRNTYFRHFKDKNELLTFKMLQLLKRWGQEHPEIEEDKYNISRYISFFELFNQNHDFIEILYQHNGETIIFNSLISYLIGKKDIAAAELYVEVSAFYSFIGIINVWVKKGMKESPQEMAEITKNMFRRFDDYD